MFFLEPKSFVRTKDKYPSLEGGDPPERFDRSDRAGGELVK